jgi:hypothetical protein
MCVMIKVGGRNPAVCKRGHGHVEQSGETLSDGRARSLNDDPDWAGGKDRRGGCGVVGQDPRVVPHSDIAEEDARQRRVVHHQIVPGQLGQIIICPRFCARQRSVSMWGGDTRASQPGPRKKRE